MQDILISALDSTLHIRLLYPPPPFFYTVNRKIFCASPLKPLGLKEGRKIGSTIRQHNKESLN
jgi:hypothetical protein